MLRKYRMLQQLRNYNDIVLYIQQIQEREMERENPSPGVRVNDVAGVLTAT